MMRRTVGVAQAKKFQLDREIVIFLELNQLDVLGKILCGDVRLLFLRGFRGRRRILWCL